MPLRLPTLRTAIAVLVLAGTAWPVPPAPQATGHIVAPLVGDHLAGTSGQPGDPDAG